MLYMDSFLILALIAAALLAGGYAAWNWWSSRIPSSAQIHGKPIATRAVGGMIVSLYGDLHNGQIQMLVRFTDSSGQLKDVGEVKTDLCRNMLDRVIHSRSDVTKTNTLEHNHTFQLSSFWGSGQGLTEQRSNLRWAVIGR